MMPVQSHRKLKFSISLDGLDPQPRPTHDSKTREVSSLREFTRASYSFDLGAGRKWRGVSERTSRFLSCDISFLAELDFDGPSKRKTVTYSYPDRNVCQPPPTRGLAAHPGRAGPGSILARAEGRRPPGSRAAGGAAVGAGRDRRAGEP